MPDSSRPSLDALRQDPALAALLTPEDRMRSLADAEAVAGVLRPMLTAPAPTAEPADNGERLLVPEEAARLLGVSRRKVYSLAQRVDWQAFVVKIDRKTLRIREGGFQRWMRRRGTSP